MIEEPEVWGTEAEIAKEAEEYEAAIAEALRAGKRLSIDDVIPRAQPALGDDPDWSSLLYANPPSHDFLTVLIIAELLRREHASPPPLKVTFLLEKGQLGLRDYGTRGILSGGGSGPHISRHHCDEMLAHVMRPAIDMIGGVNEPDLHEPIKRERLKHYCEYPYN